MRYIVLREKWLGIFALLAGTILMSGCSSAPKAHYELEKQVLHTKTTEKGTELFVFIVTVAPTPMMQVNTKKAMTRSELKRFAAYERVEDSPELKLTLEEDAVALLQEVLQERNYCTRGHEIKKVFWRSRSVQLRGECK